MTATEIIKWWSDFAWRKRFNQPAPAELIPSARSLLAWIRNPDCDSSAWQEIDSADTLDAQIRCRNAAFQTEWNRWKADGKRTTKPLSDVGKLIDSWQRHSDQLLPSWHENGVLPDCILDDGKASRHLYPIHDDPDLVPLPDIPEGHIMVGDKEFGPLKPVGNEAPMHKRLMYQSLLSVPRRQFRPGGRFTLTPSLDELVRMIWTDPGKRIQAKEKTAVLHATKKLDDLGTLRESGIWFYIKVRQMPRRDGQRAILQFQMPDDAEARGPYVHRGMLAKVGTISDPAFNLLIGLSAYWDRAKAVTKRKQAKDGKKRKQYRVYAYVPVDADGKIIPAAEAPPDATWIVNPVTRSLKPLHIDDLVAMAHPDKQRKKLTDAAWRNLRERTGELLHRLADDTGYMIAERDGQHWRVYERSPHDPVRRAGSVPRIAA